MRQNQPSCSSLLLRIYNQHVQDARNTHLTHIRKICCDLFIYLFVLLIFQCHNRVYNAWKGPFPMNLQQFRHHFVTNYDFFGYKSLFSSWWFLFQPEYIQIDLGRNAIDQSNINTFHVFYGHYSYGNLLYIFRPVLPSIDIKNMPLYIKFAADEQSYSRIRYPYRFQSFSINTLRCIVEQLAIPSTEFMYWPEKSMYVETIEQLYNKDPVTFNQKVIKECGILIGYLYQPTNEYMFPTYSYNYHQFSKNVRAFDASCSYTPYGSYVFIAIFVYLLFKSSKRLVRMVIELVHPSFPMVDSSIDEQLRTLNSTSVHGLDNLCFETTYENNYHDRLFIVDDKYLVMFMIDLQENNREILRDFYEKSPLIVIPIENIRSIKYNCIVLKNGYNLCVSLPVLRHNNRFNPTLWLHERLMDINDEYRHAWEEEEEWRYREQIRRAQEEEYRHLLAALTEEEAQYQWRQYRNDINRIWHGITSASPRFIAQFRLTRRSLVHYNLLDVTCSICLEHFQLNEYFAQWPCTAQHTFHFDCMLGVLRAGNTCPLCRHPVEAANLLSRDTVFRLLFSRMMPNVFM